ncbi:glutamine--fructose-6-phosphate transaminase (isomerizing) [bacterium]|nr:glutamine--fructose-6-phosphate transaminase (isomerizing) [bacterium]
MCGICGVAGKFDKTSDIGKELLTGLINLEYRGYDSCGMATLENKNIHIRKNVGKVQEVNTLERLEEMKGDVGIAHSRWSTHGIVNQENSHPHPSCNNEFVVVHNGIISNYKEIKERLIAKNHKFLSNTDTEVIPHLLEENHKITGNVEKALVETINSLEGTYAFAAISPHCPGHIICARNESPLMLGIGTDSNYICSDINAFIEYTRHFVALNDYEYAIISKDNYTIKNVHTGEVVHRDIQFVNWDPELVKKGGFSHYMLKEIHEQPQVIQNAMKLVDKNEIDHAAEEIFASKERYLIGVGTTYYVVLAAQYYFKSIADIYIPVISSDEFEHLASVDKDSIVIAASQSGETYDTIRALRNAKNKGAKTCAVVNALGSSMSREVDIPIMQNSGPEICVLSTKAALAQIIIFIRIALSIALKKGVITSEKFDEYEEELEDFPMILRRVIDEKSGFIKQIAQESCKINNWLFLGRGIYCAIALESALKLKEVTYLHAEGMPAGFMKHGPISLVDDNMYSLFFIPPKEDSYTYQHTISNVEEIKSRKGFIIAFHFDEDTSLYSKSVKLPPTSVFLAPLVHLVCGQLFAYFSAVALKRDVDKPRSLAKSVTVA